MRKFKIITAVVCITLLYATVANAIVFGGKWPKKGLYYKVDYSLTSRSGYESAADNAASVWSSSTGRNPYFQKVTYDSTIYDVLIKKASYAEEVYMKGRATYGVGYPAMDKATGEIEAHPDIYQYGEAILCMAMCDPLTSTEKKQTITHELGHILGLAHNNSWFSDSIMDVSQAFDFNAPTSYDLNDIRSLYP